MRTSRRALLAQIDAQAVAIAQLTDQVRELAAYVEHLLGLRVPLGDVGGDVAALEL